MARPEKQNNAVEKTGAWKPAKTKSRFPPSPTPPWKSRPNREIPTFPPRRRQLRAQIGEAWLLPVLEQILKQFPFRIRGFHSDNGSEFVNHTVAQLLNKLLIEQTKSRPRHSNDNGLVESKNGAVIRKHMGYGHIAAAHAEAIHRFYCEHLNAYVNFHRPSAQADIEVDAKGRKRRRYRRYQTPLESLLALEHPERFLRPGATTDLLRQQASRHSDTEAARQMQLAKQKLFNGFRRSA